MTSGNDKKEIGKYQKLLGVSSTSDLSELKQRYADLHEKIQLQQRSSNGKAVRRGQKNMQLLDQAFTVLAADIRKRELEEQTQQSKQTMIVEHAALRVGFRVMEGGNFFRLTTTRVTGLGSTRTNALLSTSWPTGKLCVYDSYLELKCLLGSFNMSFSEIDSVVSPWFMPLWLRIRKKDRNAEVAYIFGWGLGRQLRDIVQTNRLPLKLGY